MALQRRYKKSARRLHNDDNVGYLQPSHEANANKKTQPDLQLHQIQYFTGRQLTLKKNKTAQVRREQAPRALSFHRHQAKKTRKPHPAPTPLKMTTTTTHLPVAAKPFGQQV
jgi:hypothetical protein